MSRIQFDFRSKYLFGSTNVNIILPDRPLQEDPRDFYGSGKKYKVLWLLHGGTDDSTDWGRLTNIELYARERDVAVVMPCGLNAFYSNWSDSMPGLDVYNYFFDELMPMIYNWFPVSDDPKDNFIAGQSMGGLGTGTFVAAHPEKFGGAAIFSVGMVDLHKKPDNPLTENIVRQVVRANKGLENAIASQDNSWDRLAQRKDELPRIYCSCGTADRHYTCVYLPFKQYAQRIGLPIEFSEVEGYDHEWRLWDREIQKALDLFGMERIKR